MSVQAVVSRFSPYIISVVIAVVSFLSGAVTDIGQAVQLAITPEKAVVQAAELINETPPVEVEKALQEK